RFHLGQCGSLNRGSQRYAAGSALASNQSLATRYLNVGSGPEASKNGEGAVDDAPNRRKSALSPLQPTLQFAPMSVKRRERLLHSRWQISLFST
ncbi:hypothetical protein, partial [Shimia aestuarii]|uniref:hypothetical protein n=1 Tax=Shimia aestuarii TaxID=254406 RepID=UPI001FB546E0